mmetsp:Transcript_15332/g.40827  ORF Transcript_15332/g.40827 Transcript_15332/m.40827 type:complete len:102 (-) Transcript_15332:184-489(-)
MAISIVPHALLKKALTAFAPISATVGARTGSKSSGQRRARGEALSGRGLLRRPRRPGRAAGLLGGDAERRRTLTGRTVPVAGGGAAPARYGTSTVRHGSPY